MHVEGFTGPFVSDAARLGMLESIHGSELSVDQPNDRIVVDLVAPQGQQMIMIRSPRPFDDRAA